MTEIRLARKGVRSRVPHTKFVEDSGREEMGISNGEPLCDQRCILHSGDIWSEVELRSCACRGWKAAGSLAAYKRIRRCLNKSLITETAKQRIFIADMKIDTSVAAVIVNNLI